jgi:hypothetical protein
VRNEVASGDWVAMQVDREGVLAIPVAGMEAGATMRAWFAMFLQLRDGNCFELT